MKRIIARLQHRQDNAQMIRLRIFAEGDRMEQVLPGLRHLQNVVESAPVHMRRVDIGPP